MKPWAHLLKNVTFQFGNRRAGSLFNAMNQPGYSGAFFFSYYCCFSTEYCIHSMTRIIMII